MNIDTRKRFLINIAYWAVIIIIVYVAFKYLIGLLLPFLLAFLVVAMLRPAVKLISKKFHTSLGVSSIICDILFFTTIGILIAITGVRVVTLIIDVFARLPAFYTHVFEPSLRNAIASLETFARGFDIPSPEWIDTIIPEFMKSLGDAVTRLSIDVVGFLSDAATRLPRVLLDIMIMIIATFFLSVDYENISSFILKRLPEKTRNMFLDIGTNFKKTIFQYGKSYLIILFITFCELVIGLRILQIKNVLIIALITSLVDMLPVLGTGIVLIPWALMSLLQGKYFIGFGLLVLYIVMLVIRQIIEPKIVGKQVGLHPLVTLMSIFIGGSLFGFIGILCFPLTMAIVQNLTGGRWMSFKSKDPQDPK